MKLLSIIFSLYILCLSALPCGDAVACYDHEIKKEHSQKSNLCSDQDTEDADDACSPFCICSCCGVSVVQSCSPQVVNLTLPVISTGIVYSESSYQEVASVIRQPPKLTIS